MFMGKGGVIALRVPEGLEVRHLHIIGADAVISLIPAMPDGRAGGGKKPLGVFDALNRVKPLRCRCEIVRGQAVDLLDVKNRVAFQKRNIPLGFLAGRLVGLGARE